ncbi:hypothetical protein ED312_09785 [Sinomicrobium pectinilyticum]|uniref:Uncharacterized protein n=1 Tax=Sinomicrobium pectinilyticum TaxID=1084421 RepID=A0A3N0EJ49_SINP1|nr:DUF6520 family protein [Sinomicrobium pectinilyticum]RNL87794.1 hypothetical protein ED312_09785 [Sinomicrobium pectinilyticum]
MKSKKFLLGGLILVFAIGSAVASAFIHEQVHVRGKVNLQDENWKCVPTNVYCHDQGTFECTVRIPVSGILTNVIGYQGPGYIAPETLCANQLRRDNPATPVDAVPQTTILQVRPSDLR